MANPPQNASPADPEAHLDDLVARLVGSTEWAALRDAVQAKKEADIARLARTISGTGNLPDAVELAYLRGQWKGAERVLGTGERRAGAHEARLEKIRAGAS